MKSLRIFSIVTAFVALVGWGHPGKAETVVLANGEWAPYLSENLPEYGYASAVVREAFAAVGLTVRYEFYPWARAEALVREGAIDGSVIWSFSEERAAFALFSDPVLVQEEVIYFRRDRLVNWKRLSDLRGMQAAVALGSKIGAIGEAVDKGLVTVHRVPDVAAGFRMLLRGRLDIFPIIRPVAEQILRRDFSRDERDLIVAAPQVIDHLVYRLMLSKARPGAERRVEQFNRGLAIITENGTREALQALLDTAPVN